MVLGRCHTLVRYKEVVTGEAAAGGHKKSRYIGVGWGLNGVYVCVGGGVPTLWGCASIVVRYASHNRLLPTPVQYHPPPYLQYPFIEDVSIEEFDLGALPFRLDSLRVLPTQEDELILEVGI